MKKTRFVVTNCLTATYMSCLRTKKSVKSRHRYLTEENTAVIDIFRGTDGFAMGFARGAR
ncbi:MAG: hypothetical protein ABSB89_02785 [Candidatus Bathyarchaeia archaeon]